MYERREEKTNRAEVHTWRADRKCQPTTQADGWEINLPLTGPSVLLPPRPPACVLLFCAWLRDGGQPKVKLGELCIFGEGVWLLLLWLLQRTRLRVFSDAEPDRELLKCKKIMIQVYLTKRLSKLKFRWVENKSDVSRLTYWSSSVVKLCCHCGVFLMGDERWCVSSGLWCCGHA